MTPDDLFIMGDPDVRGFPSTRANPALIEQIRQGTQGGASDAEAALALAEQLHSDLTAYGTGGGEALDNSEVKAAIRALTAACERLGVPCSLPFRDYSSFRTYWVRNDASGSWHARRVIVGDLLDPVIDALTIRAETPHQHALPESALSALVDPTAIHDSLRRMARAVDSDPRLAVSTAKDLIESTAKLVLRELGESYSDSEDVPALAARAQRALGLTKRGVQGAATAESAALARLLGSLTGLVQGVAELRNSAGTGHGRASVPLWVQPRHARLASGAASTWCALLLETLGDPNAPWRDTRT